MSTMIDFSYRGSKYLQANKLCKGLHFAFIFEKKRLARTYL